MNKLIMMVGLPASGKSTYAQCIADTEDAIIHSSDNLREELFGDVNEQDKNNELFKELHNRIKSDLKTGKNVIYDACNISYKRRKAFLDELKKINCKKICCLIATPYEKCLELNQKRDRVVPEYVIKRMYLNFDVPASFEGWDHVHIVYNDSNKYQRNISDLLNKLSLISQDNPHHTLSIGEHCRVCARNVCKIFKERMIFDANLIYAAWLHDIGKEFTKQFKNYKGEDTDIAHYYNHEHISAYNALFYLRNDDFTCFDSVLDICQLIRWHMKPYFIETEKAKNKFINLVGQDFYDRLMILHEADINAK
jgi:predicted kinase